MFYPRPKSQKINLKKFKELFYDKRLSTHEVAAFFNVTVSGLSTFRVRNNLPARGWSKHPFLGKKHTKQSRDKMSRSLKGNLVGSKNGRWCGDKRVNYQGYVLIRKPEHPFADCNGWIREHRFVMEEHLGRVLQRHENIHHINGIKSDNRLENLVVCSNSEHRKYHRDDALKALSKTPSHIKSKIRN